MRLLLVLQLAGTAWAGAGPSEGRIALTLRDAEGRLQIFTIRPDGGGRKQLTFEENNGIPIWSRDGKRIAFARMSGDSSEIGVMDADGSNQKILGPGIAPDWSPDGTRLAFSCAAGQLWVMNADGSACRPLS
ncbi:MAG: PD40 domain-containing protein, partial [Elusimicrobia bacterium]|nr:PD40 domain-containing protein [Elusimicrobiota bacterium]